MAGAGGWEPLWRPALRRPSGNRRLPLLRPAGSAGPPAFGNGPEEPVVGGGVGRERLGRPPGGMRWGRHGRVPAEGLMLPTRGEGERRFALGLAARYSFFP